MAKYRDSEFVDFCLFGTKKKINGNLRMEHGEVFSYLLKIAEVNRETKVVQVNTGALGRSATTKRHVRSVLMGSEKLPADWTVASVNQF